MASDDDVTAEMKTLLSSDFGLVNLLPECWQNKDLCWHQNTIRCPWSVSPSDDVKNYFGSLLFLFPHLSSSLHLNNAPSNLTEGQGEIIPPYAGKLHVFGEMLFLLEDRFPIITLRAARWLWDRSYLLGDHVQAHSCSDAHGNTDIGETTRGFLHTS